VSNQELAAEAEEVKAALEDYKMFLQAMDDKQAAGAGERLMDMDCGVCVSIGQHLTALAVSVNTSPSPEVKEKTRKLAVESVERILDDLSL